MVLRKIFWHKRDEVRGEWRRLHKDELYDLCFSPNTIWVIKSRRLRWARHLARMGKRRGFYCGDLMERDNLEFLGVDGRIILKWIFKKWNGEA
jgi:hypothetical protein